MYHYYHNMYRYLYHYYHKKTMKTYPLYLVQNYWQSPPYCQITYPLDRLFVSGAFDKECIYLCMAIASSPAGPVLAGPVFMVIFETAHVQTNE